MSDFTVRAIQSHVITELSELHTPVKLEDFDSVEQAIVHLLDEELITAPEVIYNHDAWEVINDNELGEVAGDIDQSDLAMRFSNSTNAFSCVIGEARMVVDSAKTNIAYSIASDIEKVLEKVGSLTGWREDGKSCELLTDEATLTAYESTLGLEQAAATGYVPCCEIIGNYMIYNNRTYGGNEGVVSVVIYRNSNDEFIQLDIPLADGGAS